MGIKRHSHSAAFKAKVALEALRQEKTIAQLSSDFGIHANLISNWKKRLQQELPGIFSVKKKKKELEATRLEEELYRQIGQLKVELDWLKKKIRTTMLQIKGGA